MTRLMTARALTAITMAAGAAMLTGCATQPVAIVRGTPSRIILAIHSQPSGAYITENVNKKGGIAPQLYSYPLDQFRKDENGCIYVAGFEARWGSGASAVSPKVVKMCPSASNEFNVVLKRDPADPGLDKDLEFAARLDQQKQAAQEQRAAAQERKEAAIIEGLAAGFAGAMDARAAAAQQPRVERVAPMRCTSKKVLGRIETECN